MSQIEDQGDVSLQALAQPGTASFLVGLRKNINKYIIRIRVYINNINRFMTYVYIYIQVYDWSGCI